jgi:glyoxylase I family protein
MPRAPVSGLYGVRYQVKDVTRSIDFYTQKLGFKLERKHLPAFAQVSLGDFQLMLSGPGMLDPDGNPLELFEPAG